MDAVKSDTTVKIETSFKQILEKDKYLLLLYHHERCVLQRKISRPNIKALTITEKTYSVVASQRNIIEPTYRRGYKEEGHCCRLKDPRFRICMESIRRRLKHDLSLMNK